MRVCVTCLNILKSCSDLLTVIGIARIDSSFIFPNLLRQINKQDIVDVLAANTTLE